MKIRMFCAVALGIVILSGGAPAEEAAGPAQAQPSVVGDAASEGAVLIAAEISPQ